MMKARDKRREANLFVQTIFFGQEKVLLHSDWSLYCHTSTTICRFLVDNVCHPRKSSRPPSGLDYFLEYIMDADAE
jgi:hypothetical protein